MPRLNCFHFNPLSLYRERPQAVPGFDREEYDFNPLSLYRERLGVNGDSMEPLYISIHSPYTGRGQDEILAIKQAAVFQSTLPIQGEARS